MRLTKKKLIEWTNNKFKELEIPFTATAINNGSTLVREIEAGACRLIVKMEYKHSNGNDPINHHFLCFYTIKEYQEHLDQGYELYLKLNKHSMMYSDMEIDLRKIQQP